MAVIAGHITAGDHARAHKALSTYTTQRNGGGYAAKDARKLLQQLEQLCPQTGAKAEKYRREKERNRQRFDECQRKMAEYEAAVQDAVESGLKRSEAEKLHRHLMPYYRPPVETPDDDAGMAWARARVESYLREKDGTTPAVIARNRTVGNITFLSRRPDGRDGAA